MKKIILGFVLTVLFSFGCVPAKYVNQKNILPITLKSAEYWTLKECNQVIEYYTITSINENLFSNLPFNQSVLIRAIPFNKNTVIALARKEVIEKRLPEDDFIPILNYYLETFTSFTYDTNLNKIVEQDSNYSKGYSFKVYLENISNPFEPIFLEDGYSYFFLENMEGSFSRVTEVTGLYAEDYIQLDGYLNVIITFSPFAADGKRLFENKDLNETYQLVFNGLQEDPIVLKWSLR